MNDVDAMLHLLLLWDEKRLWAEELLCQELGFEKASDLLRRPDLEPGPLGEHWYFRPHGNGVDVTNKDKKGGIDFDFHPRPPDESRLRYFLLKQLQEGNLTKKYYQPLLQTPERFTNAYQEVVICEVPKHQVLRKMLYSVESLTEQTDVDTKYLGWATPRIVWSKIGPDEFRSVRCTPLDEDGPFEMEFFYSFSVPGLRAYEQRGLYDIDNAVRMYQAVFVDWLSLDDFRELDRQTPYRSQPI